MKTMRLSGGGYVAPPAPPEEDRPAWVPANATIHIDFVGGTPQGRAWVAGTGEVAVNTLLGSSELVPTDPYDSDDLIPDAGYPGRVALTGAAAAVMGGDFTILTGFDTTTSFNMVEGTFATDLSGRYGLPPTSCRVTDNGTGSEGTSLHIPETEEGPGEGVAGIGRMAITYVGETAYAAANGVQWVTTYWGDPVETVASMTRPVPCTDFLVSSGNTIRNIALFPVLSEEDTVAVTV